jgi:hypothetical protein
VKRSFGRLTDKFRIHNVPEAKISRLTHLRDQFLRRQLKGGGGLSDPHWSVMRLLLLLSQGPLNVEEAGGLLFGGSVPEEGALKSQQYMDREERERVFAER